MVGEIREQAAMQFLTLAAGGTRALTTIHVEPRSARWCGCIRWSAIGLRCDDGSRSRLRSTRW